MPVFLRAFPLKDDSADTRSGWQTMPVSRHGARSSSRQSQTGDVSLDPLRSGLIPYWCNDPNGGRKPINAKFETVRDCRRSAMRTASAAALCQWTGSLSGRR
jgi:putative SOS response-associated peptidase YedK